MHKNNVQNNILTYLPHIIYGLIFVLYLPKIVNIRLFLDDHVLIWPALTKTYLQDIVNYTYGFGLYRPFRLIFLYYPLYTLYTIAPWLPYLFLFSTHVVTGILIYKITRAYTEKTFAFLLSLVYITFPFFTEQYAWIATGTTIVNGILFLQLYILLISKLSLKYKIIWIFFLQFIGAFTYDALFFNFLLLGFVLYRRRKELALSFSTISIYSFLFAIPSCLYVFLRSFVWYPHDKATLRELQLTNLPHIISIEWQNLLTFLNSQRFLFLGKGSHIDFWLYNITQGLQNIIMHPFYILLFVAILLCGYLFFHNERLKKITDKNNNGDELILYSILIAILSLLPAFLVTIPAFPFRVIAMTLWALINVLLLLMWRISKKLGYIVAIFVFLTGIIMSLQILTDMRKVYEDDNMLTDQIVSAIDAHTDMSNRVVIILNNMPYSTNTVYNYGEYLKNCITVNWCIQMELARKTNRVEKVIINPLHNITDHKTYLEFVFNKEVKRLNFIQKYQL